ncbi:hypothetical protein [Arthrobacter sp. VKM Ac-2550]|uniref:hypothetical protein n=1 Tax=Crystallibacter permensis TaxID=1938888 RepID=UPI002227E093|nr:hypothetical protein [Arthrobacter sp. VKM Ac-2550]MCW2131911.1 hypothetical protein [Arthrobacter sp. VKM Ac-2550]
MKRFPPREVLLALTVVLTGCGDPSGQAVQNTAVITGPEEEMLLVNPDSGVENFEMEAGFDGTLLLSDENCVIGRTVEGRDMALVFPAGTSFQGGNPLTVEVEGRSIEVGIPMSATLGGGVISQGQLGKLLEEAPEQCRREETFYVQTVSTR